MLSESLISAFVKTTNDKKEGNKSETVYGTVVEYGGELYVQLDGSELLTPSSATTEAKAGDRVIVTLSNHASVVTGNMSSPSASTGTVSALGAKVTILDEVVAKKVDVDVLIADEARIGELEADNVTINGKLVAAVGEIDSLKTNKLDAETAKITYATIDNLKATNIDVHNLESDYATFAEATIGRLNTDEANINTLTTNKLDAETAKITYANIDFANIKMAAVEKLFADSGIIKDLIVSEGKITGELVGVTIKGDLIEGNTVKADKLVVKGEDGIYYKLNMTAEKVEAEQTDENSLNGSVIAAKSITATKIAVDDLVAFGATIGGYHITDKTLYSGVKASADNTTRGVFLGADGQFNVGDETNFIKYIQDTDGKYKVAISADTISYGSSHSSIDDAVKEITKDALAKMEVGARNLLTNSKYGFCLYETNVDFLTDQNSDYLLDQNGSRIYT